MKGVRLIAELFFLNKYRRFVLAASGVLLSKSFDAKTHRTDANFFGVCLCNNLAYALQNAIFQSVFAACFSLPLAGFKRRKSRHYLC